MKIESFQNKIIKKVKSIVKNLKSFHPNFIKQALNLLDWHNESIIKNKIINNKKRKGNNPEYVKRSRGNVYWTQLGENVGSELNGNHFSAVIYDSYYTSIVVPISSKKDNEGKWKKKEDLVVDIGKLNDLPNEKPESYAMIHQMRTVSKKRLSTYTYKGKRLNIKLTNEQLNIIDKAIKENLVK